MLVTREGKFFPFLSFFIDIPFPFSCPYFSMQPAKSDCLRTGFDYQSFGNCNSIELSYDGKVELIGVKATNKRRGREDKEKIKKRKKISPSSLRYKEYAV